MIKFKYTNGKGETKQRNLYPIGLNQDKIFGVDISEYSEEEQEEYEAILNSIHEQLIEAIKEVGLGSNFRQFFINKMDK